MQFRTLTILPLIGALVLAPNRSSAQVTATLQFGQQQNWPPEVRVYPYSPDVDGDWHVAYRRWQPVTLYIRDGHFYLRPVPDARAIAVYRWNNQYFLPPRDAEFSDFDRRYQYDRRPRDADYDIIGAFANLFGARPPRTWGSEIVVNAYNPDLYGDWRRDSRRWRPVTVYYRDGRYFSRSIPGSRAVAVYRWNNQYFLPPQDQDWNNNYDRRYNYGRRPTDEDYRDIGRMPGQYGRQNPDQYGRQPGDSRYGNDVQVGLYSPQVHGDWRNSYNRWETVTLYNANGRYYATQVPGARPLMVYRWQNQYFLPPQDQGWDNLDRRYDYRLRPTADDYSRVQRTPGRGP